MDADIKAALKDISKRFETWDEFLMEEVQFNEFGSVKHAKSHPERVLLTALLIGRLKGLDEKALDTLATAAVFHDSRRCDDMYDVGHGDRAAEYYREYAKDHGMDFDERAFLIMKYHDRDDEDGIRAIAGRFGKDDGALLLYDVFKDADGLDRIRLGKGELDPKYLRTDEAKGMLDFAAELLAAGPATLMKDLGNTALAD
ncbi:MAG: hypothetical protein LUB61_06160 [Eggerthellaceae bacterium]|nr:hypothetical protein [Eggerthellaceae bacterium]